MSDKPQHQKTTTPVGCAVYPRVTGPEPDKKFDAAGVWHTKMAYMPEELEDFIALVHGVRDEFQAEIVAENKRKYAKYTPVDCFEEELDDDGNETGRLIIKTKMKAHVTTKTGKEWDQEPKIFDSSLPKPKPLNQRTLKLGGGSRIRCFVELVPYAIDSTKTIGVSLRLNAVQVVELREWSGSAGSPFDGFEDGFSAPEDEDEGPFDDEEMDLPDDDDGSGDY